MSDHTQDACCGMLPVLILVGALDVPGAAPTGYYSYLASDTVLMTIFACMVVLLLGVLTRMRQLRVNLEHETASLRKSESHLRMMGDNLPDLTIFQLQHDLNSGTFRFSFLSKGYEQVLGLQREHLLDDAQMAMDYVYENDIPVLQKAFESGRQSLEAISIEIRVLDVHGMHRWLHISAFPQRDDHLLVWDGFMRDFSNEKEAKETVDEDIRNLQNLFETIEDFLIVCDMDGQLLHSNPSLEKRLGYSHSELASMSIFELYSRESQEEVFRAMAQLHTDSSASCRLPMQMKSGESIMLELCLFEGTWKHKKAVFGVARDVARYQQTETALRESKQMLQLIIDSIPMSIFWKDKDSMYLGCNEAFCQECRVGSMEDVVGKTPYDLFDPETAKTIVERDQGVISTNQSLMNHSESHTCPDGSIGWRDISLIPLRNGDSKASGVLGVWREVTEQNRAEERLKRTLDDMERFNQLMRGRERRTLELKDEINDLLMELGRPKKYRTTAEDMS